MFKRIFALLLFSIICSPQAKASPEFISEYDLVNKVLAYKTYGHCSANGYTCLQNFTIKDTIYLSGFTTCDTVLSGGSCSGIHKRFFSKNPQLLVDMIYQNMLDTRQKTYAERKRAGYDVDASILIGYGDCERRADSTLMCWTIEKVRTQNGDYEEKHYQAPVGGGFVKGPTNCPSNYTYLPGLGCETTTTNRTISAIKNSCQDGNCPNPMIGQSNKNPTSGGIDLMTGSKVENKIDLKVPFEFSRNYVSKRASSGNMGSNWKHNYDKSLTTHTSNQYDSFTQQSISYTGVVIIAQENDQEIYFTRLSPTEEFLPAFKDQKDYSLTVIDGQYELKAPNGNRETYSNDGKLTEIKNRSGYKLNLSYSGNNLTQITDSYGQYINLEYNGNRITKLITSVGDVVDYLYNGEMISNQYLNGKSVISYGYDGKNLINKTNAKGQVVSSYVYDSNNNAIQSMDYGVNAATNIKSITYPAPGTTSPVVVIENGATKNYYKTKSFNQDVPSTTNFIVGTQTIPKEVVTYSANKNLITLKDVDGNTYNYTYDADGWLATTTKNSIVTSFTWDKTNNLLLSSSDNLRITNYSYNNDGLIIEKSIISANSGTRVWSYTWGSLGKLESQTEPNGATTTYTYYSDNDADNVKGKLYKITNALGHEITVNSYDNRENPTSITLANGLTQNYTYNDLGQILTETVNGVTINYTYDEDGLLIQAQLPTGYVVNYGYDPLGRRISLTDNMGGAVSYAYDENNLPINESVYANSNLQLTANRIYDGLGRLSEAWKADVNEKSTYKYSPSMGFKPYTETNPRGSTLTYTYNKSLISAESGQGRSISNSYDTDNNLTRISANSVVYTMTYNEFAEVLTSTNLNTGTETYTYDIANKTNTKTDSAGITHTTQLDLLSRPLTVDSAGMQKVFVYDTNQVGKLTSAQNGNTLVEYTYNNLGQPLTKTQTVNGMSKTITYDYNTIGQVTKVIYPSGLEINYTYNNGLVNNITATGLGNIVQNINYQPITFIPLSWTWGNNLNRSKTLDTSGKIVSLNDGVINQTYGLDGVFNITYLNDNGVNKYYEYTANASALSRMYGDAGIVKYTIGSKIERTAFTDFNAKSFSYYYIASTNKLDYFSDGSKSYKVTYDAKGNTLVNTLGSFTYDNQNNMNSANANNQTTSYIYNAFDERVAKIGSEVNKTFMYNDNHQLIGEYEGNLGTEYIYLGSTPIATYKNGQIFFIHTDHLETPRAITNSSGSIVWKWDNIDPFGRNVPLNMGIDFNLRFMGQYFDNETGLFYNYYRYYNPSTGRYMQVDPIGIEGGLDTYSYVGQNPVNFVDPLGLKTYRCSGRPHTYPHSWLTINKTYIGWNPDVDKILSSQGKLLIEDNKHAENLPGNDCEEIKVPKQQKFEECLLSITSEAITDLEKFKKKTGIQDYEATSLVGDNCFSASAKMVNYCKGQSK